MIFDVRDFGATGNGTTDDTAAIQAAADAAHADGGGSVYIPAGTYIVTGGEEASDGCIMLYNNITVYGDGMGETTIKLKSGWSGDITGIFRDQFGIENHDITMHDLTIDGNRANTSGKIDGWFNGVAPGENGSDTNITLDSIEIKNCTAYGFDPHEITENLSITNCISHGNGLDGFALDFQINATVSNNIAYDNDRHGFNICTSTNNLDFINNIAYSNGANGVMVQRGSEDIPVPKDILVQGGSFYDNGKDGIQINKADFVTIDGVDVHDNGQRGIRIMGSIGSIVENSTIHNNSQSKDAGYDEIYIQSYDDRGGVSGRIYYTTNTLIKNNNIFDTTSINALYGIREANDGTDYTNVTQNNISGTENDTPKLYGEHSSFSGDPPPPPPPEPGETYVFTWSDWLDPSTPKITSFDVGPDGDKVDVSALLDYIGYTGTNALADGYIKLADITSGMKIQFDQDGPGGTGAKELVKLADVKVADFSVADNLITQSGSPPPPPPPPPPSVIEGTNSADNMTGTTAADTMSGLAGDDIIHSDGNNDTLYGNDGNDKLYGDSADDLLYGGNGNDWLNGGSGNDRLYGEMGNDTLLGDKGNDTLNGDGGKDTFQFNVIDFGYDIITDFVQGEDKIKLSSLITSNFGEVQSRITTDGTSTFITFGSNVIELSGFTGTLQSTDVAIYS